MKLYFSVTEYLDIEGIVVRIEGGIRISINNRESDIPSNFIRQIRQMDNDAVIELDNLSIGRRYMMNIPTVFVQAMGMGMVYQVPDNVGLLCIWEGQNNISILRTGIPDDMENIAIDPSQIVNISQVDFNDQGREISYYGKNLEETIARSIVDDVIVDDMMDGEYYVITFSRRIAQAILGEFFNETLL